MSKINKIVCTVVYWLFLGVSLLEGAILKIESIVEVAGELDTLGDKALIIFDVDHVLITPLDKILKAGCDRLRSELFASCFEGLSQEKQDFLYSSLLQQAKQGWVEMEMPLFVKALQAKKFKVIAINGLPTGKLGAIGNLADFRIQQLKQMGYDFSPSSTSKHVLKLKIARAPAKTPLLKRGVLFTDLLEKGPVIAQFILDCGFKPQRVILVDDRLESLLSVQEVCLQVGIEFIGIHYQVPHFFADNPEEEVAIFQIQYLVDQGKWLDDETASKILRGVKEAPAVIK